MRKNSKKRFKKRIFAIILCLSSILIVFFSAVKVINFIEKNIKLNASKSKAQEIKKISIESSKNSEGSQKTSSNVEVLLSSAGDCTIGTDPRFDVNTSLLTTVRKNNNDYSYLFKNAVPIFEKDDITIVNLETTFTNAKARADKTFTFKAPPEFAKALNLGSIEGVNISNNHIHDFLDKGFNDTIETLKQYNVNYFGENNKWIKEVKGVKFGFLGYQGWSNNDKFMNKLKQDIRELKSQGCIVVINFHWGEEGSYYPNSTQKSIAHYAIDQGADLIIGHHPHVIEGIERYKDKIICYSLGNFCFGGNSNPSDKDTFVLQTKFSFNDNKLVKYDIRVIPFSISSVKYTNNYCPTPLSGDDKERLLKKINNISTNLESNVTDSFN